MANPMKCLITRLSAAKGVLFMLFLYLITYLVTFFAYLLRLSIGLLEPVLLMIGVPFIVIAYFAAKRRAASGRLFTLQSLITHIICAALAIPASMGLSSLLTHLIEANAQFNSPNFYLVSYYLIGLGTVLIILDGLDYIIQKISCKIPIGDCLVGIVWAFLYNYIVLNAFIFVSICSNYLLGIIVTGMLCIFSVPLYFSIQGNRSKAFSITVTILQSALGLLQLGIGALLSFLNEPTPFYSATLTALCGLLPVLINLGRILVQVIWHWVDRLYMSNENK